VFPVACQIKIGSVHVGRKIFLSFFFFTVYIEQGCSDFNSTCLKIPKKKSLGLVPKIRVGIGQQETKLFFFLRALNKIHV